MISILNLEPEGYSSKAKAILQTISNVDEGPLTRGDLLQQIPVYDALIVRLHHSIDLDIINAGKNLKIISTATTGLNHIDINYAREKNIDVISLKGETDFLENIHATAELTWALILSAIRKIPQSIQSVKTGNWDRDSFKGRELNGATLGIIGLGRIGKKVAKFGLTFGMKVIAYTKNIIEQVDEVNVLDSLTTVLKNSDVISIHVPLDSTTKSLLGNKEFKLMKKGALFINTSRGEVIDESALVESIKAGHLSGAALDVLKGESNILQERKSKIIEFANNNDRLIITPHIGGATFESMEKTEIYMAKKLVNYFS